MSENIFKVKLTGPGLDFEKDIDAEKVSSIIQLCLSTCVPQNTPPLKETKTIENSSNHSSSLSKNNPSLVEWFNRFSPKRNPDKILCFASYLIDVQGRECFEPDEIKPLFQKCGEPIPKNFPRDFRWTISNGWLDESLENSGQFFITNTGRQALESNFDPEILKKTKAPELKKRKRKTRATASESGE